MWQILFCNFAAYKKINLGNAGRMTLYISPVCCERKNKDTWRQSHNKTVIYYLFFVVVIDWKLELSEQHITRASLRYFLQGSVITFIQYIWHVHGISFKWKNRKKEKPICQKRKERWLIVQLPSNLVLSHRERCRWPADSKRRQRRHKRCNCRQDIP